MGKKRKTVKTIPSWISPTKRRIKQRVSTNLLERILFEFFFVTSVHSGFVHLISEDSSGWINLKHVHKL